MKKKYLLCAAILAMNIPGEVFASDAALRVRALRAARSVVRGEPSPELSAKRNTDFQGLWGGRYIFYPGASTCGTSITSINFRHVLSSRGSSGYLATNHAGDFTGRSRDRGRRWEFVKGTSVNGRQAALVVVYQSLARNGSSAGTGISLTVRGGCTYTYVANAIRLAR